MRTKNDELWRRASAVVVDQRNEGAAVAVGEFAHERGELDGGILDVARAAEAIREADGVNAHQALAVRSLRVESIDGVGDAFHRLPRVLVAEDVQAHLFVRRGEGADGGLDAVYRRGEAEGPPIGHRREDGPPARRRIRYPLAREALEHITAVVVHDLYALHLGIQVEGLS